MQDCSLIVRSAIPRRLPSCRAGSGSRSELWSVLGLVIALAAITVLAGCGSDDPQGKPLSPVELRVELLRGASVAISATAPRFSWRQPDGDTVVQTAYRIVVGAGDQAGSGGPIWDSGAVPSDRSQGIRYTGPALQDGGSYYWAVQIWNEDGVASEFSAWQFFSVVPADPAMPPRLPLASFLVEPEEVLELGPGHIFVAFPAVAYGTVVLDFSANHPAGELLVEMGEHRVGDSVWRSASDGFTPEISLFFRSKRLFTDGSPRRRRLELPESTVAGAAPLPNGLSDIQPFRYVEIQGDVDILKTMRVLQEAVNYPFDDSASNFLSSDPVLNDVWEMSRYTMKATSAFGLYVDGNRERLPYEADAYINQLGHYSVDADYSLARYTNAYLLRNPSWPTEWLFHNHLLAWADYEYTADDAYLAAHYDELVHFLLLPLAREDGLISTRTGLVTAEFMAELGLTLGPEDIVDWPAGERDSYDMSVQYSTVVNLFHWRSLDIMSNVAAVLGKERDESEYRQRADRVRRAIVDRMFDPLRGVFVDGEGSTHSSLHANMFALAFGVVPEGYRSRVVDFTKSRGMATSVYGAQYLLDGLYANRESEYALSLLTSRGPRSWAHMIYGLGATIAHEAWDPVFKPNEDWNHAWGAAPANIIPRWLMGVRPIDPGFARFLVNPQPGSLDWAELRFPSIRGPIRVRFERRVGYRIVFVGVPANSMAYVAPPCTNTVATHWPEDTYAGSDAALGEGWVGPLSPGNHEVRCDD